MSSEEGQHGDQRIKEPDTGKKVLFYSASVRRSVIGKDLITAFQYLRGSYRRDEDIAFQRIYDDRTRANRHKVC